MDVSKFTLDRNGFLGAASGLYDSAKSGVAAAAAASAYSAYIDPSMLTKAYFDSKMYHDRANYALDITKMYQQQQQQQQNAHMQHQQQQQQQQQQDQHDLARSVISQASQLNLSSHNNHNTSSIDERDSNSQTSDSPGDKILSRNGTTASSDLNDESSSTLNLPITPGGGAYGPGGIAGVSVLGYQAYTAQTAATATDYRRPLTVIF